MKGFILALQFLTRFPIPITIEFTSENLKKSLFFFPLISAFIGFCIGGVVNFIRPYNSEVASLMGLIIWILLNGGLHMDGLADMFDGFLSNRNKNKVLEIMKDSRVGTFGVLSLLIVIISKIILIQAIFDLSPWMMGAVLLSARMGVLYSIAFFPSARPGGMGEMFQKGNPGPMVYLMTIMYGLIFILFSIKSLILLLVGILSSLFISKWSMKKIHGVSGDVFGAIMEIGEVMVLFTYWGVSQWNLF